MRRAPACTVASLLACTPPAGTVGGWTGGDTTAAGGSSSSSGVASSSSSSTSSSSSADEMSASTTTIETGSESTTTAMLEPPPWVATITGSPPRLHAIDLDGGTIVDACELAIANEPDALAFLPDDRLVGAHAVSDSLWIADPCDCAIEIVPMLEPPLSLQAIAEVEAVESTIVGADATRAELFDVVLAGPQVQALGDLAQASAITALAATPGSDRVHALAVLDGVHLLRIEPVSGAVESDLTIDVPSTTTGLTIAPNGATLVACDDDGTLWSIDPADGTVDALAVDLPSPCRTLATPHGSIDCIDALFAE